MKKTRNPLHRLIPAALGQRAAVLAFLAVSTPLGASADDQATNRLGNLAVRETEQATEIVVTCTGAPTFTVFKLNDPIRLFIDVSNADTSALSGPVEIDNGVVGEVSALQFNDSMAHVGRIIIGLEVDALYKVQANGNQLVVTVDASQRKRKAVPVAAAAGPDPAAVAQLAALEARAAEAERRAQDAEHRARELDQQAHSADARATEVAREAESNRERAAQAEREKAALSATVDEARAQAERERQAALDARSVAAAQQRAAEAAKSTAEQQKRDAEEAKSTAEQQKHVAELARDAAVQQSHASAEVAEQAKVQAASEKARAEHAAAEKVAAEAATEKARAETIAAEAAAEQAMAEKAAAEAATERAVAQAASERAAAEKATRERAAAQSAADLAARNAANLESRAQQSEAGSREGQRARAEAGAARMAAEQAAGEKIAAEKAASAALARAQAAEARAQTAETDRRKLQDELGALETQRQSSLTQITALESAQDDLNRQLAQARKQNDDTATRRIEAEQSARQAELASQRAEIARLESVKANSAMDTRLKALQGELSQARAGQSDAQAGAQQHSHLQKSLEDLTQESARLKEALRQRDSQLQTAREEAQRRRDKADALPGRAPTPAVAAAAAVPQKQRISDVRFDDLSDHTEIRVRLEGRAEYELRNDGERTRILEVKNALIDPSLERSLDTGAFPSAVQLVSSFQAPGAGDRVRIVVTLREKVADRVRIDGKTLVWSFDKPAERASAAVAREVEYARPVAAVYTGPAQMAGAAATTGDAAQVRKAKKRYVGTKINIDIKDADVHNVLRLLAKEGNVNIVTSDSVTGTVTVHLKLVPWDQALDLVLKSKGLDMVQDGNIIRVGRAEDIAKEREAEVAAQTVKAKLKPLGVKLISINNAVASELIQRVQSVLTDRGKVEFDTRTNTLIVKDVDESVEAAEDLVRRLDTQTPQVLIEARIVEVNTNAEQQFGIQWGGDSTWSAATGNPTGLRFPSVVGISGAADDPAGSVEGTSSNPNFIVNMPAAIGAGSGGGLGFTFGSVDGTFNLNVRLSAAQSSGQVKIVSSPKITTLDNNMAEISQGVSIPISQVSAAGVNTVFYDATLSLKVKPHVTQDGTIYLDVTADNNTPDFQNVGARGDPTILKKNARTNVLVKDGDTTVIGGIYTTNSGMSQAEVPFFARIPILGVLFRNHRESDLRTELLIFVTPHIVNRSAASVRTNP